MQMTRVEKLSRFPPKASHKRVARCFNH
jgi:hypothetical protein